MAETTQSGAVTDTTGTEAFDATAFQATLMAEVNKAVNGAVAGVKKDILKQIETLKQPTVTDPPPTDPASGNQESKKQDTETTALKRQLEALQRTVEQQTERAKQADLKRQEAERLSTFNDALTNAQFANEKARQQFTDAYLGKLTWSEDEAAWVVNTDKGPLKARDFLKAEYEASTHLQPPTGSGGAGATAGRTGSRLPDISQMSPAQIRNLPAEQRAGLMQEAAAAISQG